MRIEPWSNRTCGVDVLMNDAPDIDLGTPPGPSDEREMHEWWSNAQDALREHFDDPLGVWLNPESHVAPRYQVREVEVSESVEVPNADGTGVTLETRTWTEERREMVGEKIVTGRYRLDVEVGSDAEMAAVTALAESAGLNLRELGERSRCTHRLEPA